jgi:hypothetical protein
MMEVRGKPTHDDAWIKSTRNRERSSGRRILDVGRRKGFAFAPQLDTD